MSLIWSTGFLMLARLSRLKEKPFSFLLSCNLHFQDLQRELVFMSYVYSVRWDVAGFLSVWSGIRWRGRDEMNLREGLFPWSSKWGPRTSSWNIAQSLLGKHNPEQLNQHLHFNESSRWLCWFTWGWRILSSPRHRNPISWWGNPLPKHLWQVVSQTHLWWGWWVLFCKRDLPVWVWGRLISWCAGNCLVDWGRRKVSLIGTGGNEGEDCGASLTG